MKLTRKCANCKQDFHRNEMLQYSSYSGKTVQWFCRECYNEKMMREKFSNKVCSIFGIKAPGPQIWTERKRLREQYGYSDETIINCLDFIYNIEKKKKLSESLYLVKPDVVDRMMQYKRNQQQAVLNIARSLEETETKDYIVPIKENVSTKKELNPDDWLNDE